ncbi:MAG: CPBP family intramembrane metalloprotease [Chlamydiales bacterium]|nr:CPBP family intramembrane metalloprotease [Chlamydiales bacterium]
MSDSLVYFVVLALIAVSMSVAIWKWRLYELPAQETLESDKIALMTPLIGFLLFVSACAFVPAWVTKLIHYTDTHGHSSFSQRESDSFSQLAALFCAFLLLMGFNFILPKAVRDRIWGMRSIVPFLKGVLYCLIAYPVVMTIVQGIHMIVECFGVLPVHEQVALSQLKNIQNYPWLFWSFAVAIVTLIPLIEEYLFRGLLQNYFMNYFGARFAIIITSILFALFHYSALQGATNIELMVGLFIYSYFIGLFYVRERSLWTSIAMHATFNALTIFIMFYVIK